MDKYLRYDSRINASEKILYAELREIIMANGICEFTNKYFAAFHGVSTATVSKWISNLKKHGFIKTEMWGEGMKQHRVILLP